MADNEDLAITSRVFANVTWQRLNFKIYKNERDSNPANAVSGSTTYFYQPALTLIRQDDQTIKVWSNGTKVFVPFLNYSDGLIKAICEQANERERDGNSNHPQVTPDQIIMMPVRQIEIAAQDEETIRTWSFPDTSSSNTQLDEEIIAQFRCDSAGAAARFAESVKSGSVIFTVKVRVPMTKVDETTMKISTRDCKSLNWKNIINDNAGGNPEQQDSNQYVAIDQVADSFESLLSGLNISVTTEGEPSKETEITREDERSLLEEFEKFFLQDRVLDFPPSDAQDIYIGRESFNPDTINREKQNIENSMTTAMESVIDMAQEDIKSNRAVYDGRSVLETLNKEYNDISGSARVAGGFDLVDIVSGNADVSGEFKYKTSTLDQMKSDVSQRTDQQFSAETRGRMRNELKQYLNQSSKYNWEFEGSKITPKKIKLKRIVTSNLQVERTMFSQKRRLTRRESEIPFQRTSDQAVNRFSYILSETVFCPLLGSYISSRKLAVADGVSETFEVPIGFTGHVYVHVGGDGSVCFVIGADGNANFNGGFIKILGAGNLPNVGLQYVEPGKSRITGVVRGGSSAPYTVDTATIMLVGCVFQDN